MPSGQILYLMMFVGKCSCTSHVLQYSSSRSYEHSRSLQSSLCPGVVTVLICSFFVAALLLIYWNLKNGGKNMHFSQTTKLFRIFFAIIAKNSYLCTHKISSNNGKNFRFCRNLTNQWTIGLDYRATLLPYRFQQIRGNFRIPEPDEIILNWVIAKNIDAAVPYCTLVYDGSM